MTGAVRPITGAAEARTDLSERLWDVVVVGAGLAGAMVALELGRRGCEVLLLERQPFPRWKVCGAVLNAAAQRALTHAGLDGLVAQSSWITASARSRSDFALGSPPIVPPWRVRL